jgi:transcriptional regulator with XRE-family HTH domain
MIDDIYSTLRRLRIAKGWTQQQMADRLQIPVSRYGNLERGQAKITIERLREVASVFQVEIEKIIYP